jgi:hypothetical protein
MFYGEGSGVVLVIKNSTIYGNTTNRDDAGAANVLTNILKIYNSTISANASGSGAGGTALLLGGTDTLINCIVSGNTGAAGTPNFSGAATFYGNNITNNDAGLTISAGSNNLETDPLLQTFVQSGNTWLQSILNTSPAYNTGIDLTAQGITTDHGEKPDHRALYTIWDL